MIRTGLFAVIVASLLGPAPAAFAQTGPVENEDARYSFHRTDDGYLRLDGRSGQVSICARRPAGWACQTAPDERAALEAEIARLQADNSALKKELLSHNLSLPTGVNADPPPSKVDEPRMQLPSDAEFNRMMAFIEKVWKRLVEMIVNTQKDILKKS
ncbi:MAG: hypothetical protein QOC56_1528 [Alphaproteobacteria bacterium]|nr:hypothetical protein [Alphaproteobacteria bacterium]